MRLAVGARGLLLCLGCEFAGFLPPFLISRPGSSPGGRTTRPGPRNRTSKAHDGYSSIAGS